MSAPNVAFVYGSFFMGDCERDIKVIRDSFPKILGLTGLAVAEPVEGNAFDFNSLKDCKVLVICTSSQIGFPPPNFRDFAHSLLQAANTNPGCLKHLRHAVYGNGDETYFKTYMNMPRYMDLLLEKCGSTRFFARGETGEPHAAMGTEKCECTSWAPAMWTALASSVAAEGDGKPEPAVAWDALWAEQRSETHEKTTQWDLAALEKKLGKPSVPPSMFAKL
jgi:sulfite reductase alpha subunit-like flavoprotein